MSAKNPASKPFTLYFSVLAVVLVSLLSPVGALAETGGAVDGVGFAGDREPGDGGFGGPVGPLKPVHIIPDRAPDMTVDTPVLPQAALIYRLSGDPNPLHASPEVAAKAGFKAPILHGLCTFGIAGCAVLANCCENDPARLKSFNLRFSSPVFPGETVRTEIWQDGNTISFRALVGDRIVLNNGIARIKP